MTPSLRLGLRASRLAEPLVEYRIRCGEALSVPSSSPARYRGGEYALAEIPLTVEGLDGIDLQPEEIAHVLRGAMSAGCLGVEASL
ncbi:hypothetical protein [Streptomyces sp. NPDC058751]|uniref:hypothetical protein n=1 Tax=Streptomyces sp. NPDC058751 TaxID=3346623 RepID=UPI0036C92BA6